MKNKEIVKSIVVLVVICLLTSAALAVVNHFTAPVSAANAEARAQQARLDAVPDAADFAPIEAALPSGVVSAYAALDAAGTPTSYLFTVEGKGFGGTIQVLCVIGMDGSHPHLPDDGRLVRDHHARRPDRKRELHRPVRRAGRFPLRRQRHLRRDHHLHRLPRLCRDRVRGV